jgi:hypothetical protein
MNCPRCGGESYKAGKNWDFKSFNVEWMKCKKCDKTFNAYYRGGFLIYTLPKKHTGT